MAIRRVLLRRVPACLHHITGQSRDPMHHEMAAPWLQTLVIDRATGILGGLQQENEAMLHTASAADPLWQRRIPVYPNKSAARPLLRRHLEALLLMWKGPLVLCYSAHQPRFSSWPPCLTIQATRSLADGNVQLPCPVVPSRSPGQRSSCTSHRTSLQVILCLTLPAGVRCPCLLAYQTWAP
jgi:hypothetical protein